MEKQITKNKQEKRATILSDVKIEQLSKQPILESVVMRSEDGKWIIHKTTITDIKHVSYFEKVLAN